MNTFIGVLLALGVLGVVYLGVWLFIVVFREKEEDLDANILLNFLSNRSNGRFLGRELEVTEGKNGRKLIKFEPKDILFKGKNKNKPLLPEKVIAGKNKYVNFPRGTLSKDRNISMVLPINPSDLPENIKHTEIGVALMMMTEMKNLAETEIKILREGSMRKDAMLQKIGDGEISREFMSYTEELVKDYLRAQVNPKEERNKTSLNTGSPNYPQHE